MTAAPKFATLAEVRDVAGWRSGSPDEIAALCATVEKLAEMLKKLRRLRKEFVQLIVDVGCNGSFDKAREIAEAENEADALLTQLGATP